MATQLKKAEVHALLLAGNEIKAGDISEWDPEDVKALQSALDKLRARYWARWGSAK